MNRTLKRWVLLVGLGLLLAPSARANITVKGTVFYWNGDNQGGTGFYDLGRNISVHVETDRATVWDIDTWADASGKYQVVFKQRSYRPDFDSLIVGIEVRAEVRLTTISRPGPDNDIVVACYKGAVRLYPYNGQTGGVSMADGSTWTINVYVGTSENPDPPAAKEANTLNLKIDSWDYDDDGRRTVTGIFMCEACRNEYDFLRNRAASASELDRKTSIFYPEAKTAYRPGQSPPGTGWIDAGNSGPDDHLFRLFPKDKAPDPGWLSWRNVRTDIMHEFAHKLMHDVYWTMPKPYPWGEGFPLIEKDPSAHDEYTCQSEELGWVEGWADFLPAAVMDSPTLCGSPFVADIRVNPGLAPGDPPQTLVRTIHTPDNLEYVWYPDLPEGDSFRTWKIGGDIDWPNKLTGQREYNECEVASVLWDIFDPAGWEYMPLAKQNRRPPGWPTWLRWYECLADPDLHDIWAILKQEPECLNDETESESNRDSFWTFWLDKYGRGVESTPLTSGPTWLTLNEDAKRVHGLKAILYNRGMRHDLRPENDPEIVSVRQTSRIGTVPVVEVCVREIDVEDRGFLYYNVAYAQGADALKMMYEEDQPFRGPRQDDQITATIALPPASSWNRLILLVHDNMEPDFMDNSDKRWQMAADPASLPPLQIMDAGLHRTSCRRLDGSMWTWGYSGPRGNRDDHGMDKSTAEWRLVQSTPIMTENVINAKSVAVGTQHSLAVAADGTVWSWGNNYGGALGIDSVKEVITSPRSTVNQVPGLTDIISVAAGGNSSLALKSDGTVWTWGWNEKGSLGLSRLGSQRSPAQIDGLSGITAISQGLQHAMALDKDGQVWGWGLNDMGQVGDGSTKDRDRPVKVQGLPKKAVAVAAGYFHHSMALLEDGTVWEWGEIRRADRYDLAVPPGPVPRPLPGLSDVAAFSDGGGHFLALDKNGKLWAWGLNGHGQLGDGTAVSRWRAEAVPNLGEVIAIAAGDAHSAAVCSDGTIWTWGAATSNALGDATFESRLRPVQVKTYIRVKPKDQREKADAFIVFPFRLY